jgi:hypothetical protein
MPHTFKEPSPAPMAHSPMENATVEISIHGKWRTVPAMECDGNTIAVLGKWLRMAVIQDEDFLREEEIRDPQLCIEELRKQLSPALRADIFSFRKKLPTTLSESGYRMEWDSIAIVRTTSFVEWWEKLSQESRKNVRRAQKRGVEVIVKQLDDDLIRDIVELNSDSPVRQGRRFVHYGKSFDEVKRDQLSFLDRSDYVCAYVGKELIGFLKIAYGRKSAAIVQILPKASQQDKRPANALIAKAVQACEAKGMSFLTYGMFNYGNRRDSPLRQFKVRNGFEEILVPRFHVPLTAWGKACTMLRLYRGLIGIVPDRIISTTSRLRAKWYAVWRSSEAGVA